MGAQQIKKEISIAVGVIGILQALFGLIFCICCGVFSAKSGQVVAPFWSGVPLLLTGGLGIATAVTKNQCMLIAWLVINIILTILLFVSAAITGIASALLGWAMDIHKAGSSDCYNSGDNCVCKKSIYDIKTIHGMNCDDLDAVHVLLQCMTAFACLGGIVSFAGAICSCVGLCCYKNPENPGTIVVAGGGQQVIVQSQTQQQPGIITYGGQQQYPPQQQNGQQYPPNGQPYDNSKAYPPPSYEQEPVMEIKPAFAPTQ